ncbi:MAG: PEP-utilizing enzyme, partial [Gemmatimonadota bacterium]
MGRPTEEAWLGEITEQVVVVVHELSPGLTVQLDREHVVGFVTEEGTRTSHAAILARSLGIPCVMGIVRGLARVENGADVVVDGSRGTVLL